MSTQAQTKAFGPYELINAAGLEGYSFLTIPYGKVAGSQIIISSTNNFGKAISPVLVGATAEDSFLRYYANVEVAIYGAVQGFETCIKRQHVNMLSGPMYYTFDFAEAFDNIILKGRNMSGGRSGPNTDDTDLVFPEKNPTSANGYSLTASVFIQPRDGMGPSDASRGKFVG